MPARQLAQGVFVTAEVVEDGPGGKPPAGKVTIGFSTNPSSRLSRGFKPDSYAIVTEGGLVPAGVPGISGMTVPSESFLKAIDLDGDGIVDTLRALPTAAAPGEWEQTEKLSGIAASNGEISTSTWTGSNTGPTG